jgi:hypothetical protein
MLACRSIGPVARGRVVRNGAAAAVAATVWRNRRRERDVLAMKGGYRQFGPMSNDGYFRLSPFAHVAIESWSRGVKLGSSSPALPLPLSAHQPYHVCKERN